ncbi:MAG: fibronectin type III domain-containing protein [Acidobacteria bacterium]|nr:fibronectin type III domain-containing protein [Acidobacteriota bacterium]
MLLTAVLVFSAPVEGQRLLTLTPQATGRATVGDPDFAPEIAAFAAQVDLELLRTESGRLELPTPDGRVLIADLSVFEDRGGGDLMWSGGLPGAGYDSVVLTLEGGRLVGWFAEPAGVRYRISARPDGSGRMEAGFNLPGAQPDAFCAVGSDREQLPQIAPVRIAGATAHDPPTRVAAPQSHDTLEILVVYTPTAAGNWAGRGGAQAAIRNAGDYLNMVLRNGRIDIRANIVHTAEVAGLDRVGRDGTGLYGSSIISQLRFHGEALRLRREHGADLVHLFTGESPWLFNACGQHYLLSRNETAEDFSAFGYGWTANSCYADGPIFAHEVGHGLGAHHDPDNGGSPELAVRPYAFGHGNLDRIPNVGTIMSYTGQEEPYLSSVRIKPQGRVIGIAGERENERALQRTIHIGVKYGDFVSPLPPDAPAAPTDLRVTMESETSVRLSWQDNATDEDGYEATLWRPGQGFMTRPLDGRTTGVVDLPVADAGTRYFFRVEAYRGETRSASSGTVTLVTPGAEPAPPSGLAWEPAAVEDPAQMGTSAARLTWVDNSDDEYYFEVELSIGGPVRRKYVSANSRSTVLSRLEPGRAYGVRMSAIGPGGTATGSEFMVLRPRLPPGPSAVTNLTARATGPTSVRLTWTDNSTNELGFRVLALVSGWFGLFEAGADSESIEIEGLAHGGSYVFYVLPFNDSGLGRRTGISLPLGSPGRGPVAPTKLSWAVSGEAARLAWVHNSNDETGFEIQSRPDYGNEDTVVVGGGRWTRVALAPAGARHFELERSEEVDYRVFAYNGTGFSKASNTVRGMPFVGPGPTGGEGGLTAVPSGETAAELTWTGRWARPARGRLTVEARNPANGWIEVATAEAAAGGAMVTGLEPETPYTFRLRAGAADYSPEASVTTGAFQGACREESAYLCLRDDRFEVRAHWSKPDAPDEYGSGAAVPVDVSDESGLFWFFDPENIELVVKVLDGRTINGSYWVFFGALSDVEYWITVRDAQTGERRTYHNPPREVCGQKDLVAFGDLSPAALSPGAGPIGGGRAGFDLLRMNVAALDLAGLDLASEGGGHCETGEGRLCLLDDRFAVEVDFVDPNADPDVEQAAKVIPSLTTAKTGFFWFFSPSNIELAVKMLDGRALNGRFWLLYGGLSDVEYEITVTDTVTGEDSTYRNEAGSICGQIDVEAF